MEEFKNIFENYEVSNFGNVRRKCNNGTYKIINCSVLNTGYKYFQIIREGKRINKMVHQLVAQEFIGYRPENMVIDHIDRNKLNNNVSNLRYITQKENMTNTDRFVSELPIETENRNLKVCKLYRENNKEKIKEIKKKYYENNKQIILEKQRNNKVDIICGKCNQSRNITITTYNRNKRLNVNMCRKCSSILNLEKKRIN
jgi:uncharacterized membrane protein